MVKLEEIELLAVQACKKVGARMLEMQDREEKFKVSFKSETDLVTEVDLWAEKEISAMIRNKFPDHQILGEESAENPDEISLREEEFSTGYCWIVDPIDGTTNFVSSIPHSAVSIALLKDSVRQVGVVYDPFRDELFSAIKGKGAKLNRKKIEISGQASLKKSLVATGYPYSRVKDWPELKPIYELFFEESRDMRIFGASTLDQCWCACGRLDAYFEVGVKPWDVAAASLIVEEAGGLAGNPLDKRESFSSFGRSFLFASPELYQKLNSSFISLLKS